MDFVVSMLVHDFIKTKSRTVFGTVRDFVKKTDGGGGENRTRVREASAATSTGVDSVYVLTARFALGHGVLRPVRLRCLVSVAANAIGYQPDKGVRNARLSGVHTHAGAA